MPVVFKKMQMQVSKTRNNGYVPSTRVVTPLNKSTNLQSGAKGMQMISRITGVKSGCSCG